MLTVNPLSDAAAPDWDAYVAAHPDGLPHHRAGWRHVLERAYGYKTGFLYASDAGRTAGVLPLFFIRSPITGHRATTMPGGLCADSPAVAAALLDHAAAIARDAGAARLVVQDSRRAWPGPFTTSDHHVHWRVPLPADPDTLWKALDSNIRRQVRIARRHDLHVAISRDGRFAGAFYAVLARFNHQVGTPAFSRRFLDEVIAAFPNDHAIALVFAGERPIAAFFQLTLDQTMHGIWGGAYHANRKQRPIYLALWEIMADAIAHGITCLDMGRSPAGSTRSDFKGQWGGVAAPVYQQVAPLDGRPAAAVAARAQNDPAFQLVRRLWPRLPWPVASRLGPRLRRHVPFA